MMRDRPSRVKITADDSHPSTKTYEAAAGAVQHPAGFTEGELHESRICFNPR